MKSISRNNLLITATLTKYSLSVILFYIVLYCLMLFTSTLQRRENLYDLIMDMGDFFTISYMVIPLFAMLLTVYYSQSSIQNYMIFRYKKKREWYWNNVVLIGQTATVFVLFFLLILIGLSVFILDKTNQWSTYTRGLYSDSSFNLFEGSPLMYAIGTVVLLWLLLLFVGLFFLLVFILTKKTMIAFLSIILLDLVNVLVTLNKIDSLTKYLFTSHIDTFTFQGIYKMEVSVFPFQIFLYWIIIIAFVFLLGLYLINRRDLWIEKGENNNDY